MPAVSTAAHSHHHQQRRRSPPAHHLYHEQPKYEKFHHQRSSESYGGERRSCTAISAARRQSSRSPPPSHSDYHGHSSRRSSPRRSQPWQHHRDEHDHSGSAGHQGLKSTRHTNTSASTHREYQINHSSVHHRQYQHQHQPNHSGYHHHDQYRSGSSGGQRRDESTERRSRDKYSSRSCNSEVLSRKRDYYSPPAADHSPKRPYYHENGEETHHHDEARRLMRDLKRAKKDEYRERALRRAENEKLISRTPCHYKQRTGYCYNDLCKFDHDFKVKKLQQLCKYYLTGSCTRDNCIYMHKEYPCRYFHIRKFCFHGDKCCFSHEPLTREGREIIDSIKQELNVKKHENFLEKSIDDKNSGLQVSYSEQNDVNNINQAINNTLQQQFG